MEAEEKAKLKEQIKQEILEEMKTKKENQTNWARLKKEYETEFDKFNWREGNKKATWQLESAIGTLIRIIYKQDTLTKMNVNYKDMKEVTERILNILKEKREVV